MPTGTPIRQQLTCSVVVCTRDRPAQLEQCLAGIAQQTLKPIEVIVVDNAPEQVGTEDVCRRWGAKYILEPTLGLSRARNRGAFEAKGAVVAYIDDDASPRHDWLENLLTAFHEPAVMAAAGRIIAPEAEAEVMKLCWLIQGSGVAQDSFVLDKDHPQWFELAAFGGLCASGTNMAFRRTAFDLWPGFDLRLGLPNAGCEEHYAILLLVDHGHQVAYAPSAVVTHPRAYTIQGLRKRYLRGAAHSTAYILFLLVHVQQHRRKLIKFIFEGLRGMPRDWRPRADTATISIGIPSWKFYLARMAGVWAFARSFSKSS